MVWCSPAALWKTPKWDMGIPPTVQTADTTLNPCFVSTLATGCPPPPDGDAPTGQWTQLGGQVSPAGAEAEDPTMLVVGTSPAVGYRYASFQTNLNLWGG